MTQQGRKYYGSWENLLERSEVTHSIIWISVVITIISVVSIIFRVISIIRIF